MAVKGNLKDIGLTSLISINCNEMNQARLSILNQGKQAIVFFHDGNIVHAELDSEEGEDVLYKILRWEEGDFELEQGVQAGKQTVHNPWSGILLEGMHRIDESDAGLDSEQEAGRVKFNPSDANKILAALQRVAGIDAVGVCSMEGTGSIVAGAAESAILPEVASFLVQKAEGMADYLDQKGMNYILLYEGDERVLIVPYDPGLLIVSLSSRASVRGTLEVVKQLQERYSLRLEGNED